MSRKLVKVSTGRLGIARIRGEDEKMGAEHRRGLKDHPVLPVLTLPWHCQLVEEGAWVTLHTYQPLTI